MPISFEPYVRCFRCGTSRPKAKLLAGICSDNFCRQVLEVARSSTAGNSPSLVTSSPGTSDPDKR